MSGDKSEGAQRVTRVASEKAKAVADFLIGSIRRLSEVGKRISSLLLYCALICLTVQVLHLLLPIHLEGWWVVISGSLLVSGVVSTLLLFVVWFVVRGVGMFPVHLVDLNDSVAEVVDNYSDKDLNELSSLRKDKFTIKRTFKAGGSVVRALRDVKKVMDQTGGVVRSYAFVLLTINPMFWTLMIIISVSALVISIFTSIMILTHLLS